MLDIFTRRNNTIYVDVPINTCSNEFVTFCRLRIMKSDVNLFINISVKALSYSGPHMFADMCLYGGFGIYQQMPDDRLIETLTECNQMKTM